jgi:hypothetical protein
MATIILRPKGAKQNPEMRFTGKTKKAAVGAATTYLRKHPNITAGFYDEDNQFHPIRASRDYSPSRAGEGRRSKPRKAKAKKAKKNPARRRAKKQNFGQRMARLRARKAAKRRRK